MKKCRACGKGYPEDTLFKKCPRKFARYKPKSGGKPVEVYEDESEKQEKFYHSPDYSLTETGFCGGVIDDQKESEEK